MNDIEKLVVALKEDIDGYPAFPFSPPENYPELKLLPYEILPDSTNRVYGMIRKMFYMYNLDDGNYGTEKWNPLSKIVSKGNTVVIKPNLVRHQHPLGDRGILSTVTHSALVRPIIDYTILALKGEGKIVIGDSPFLSTDFDEVCKTNKLRELIDFYRSKLKDVQVSLVDLRKEIMKSSHQRFGKERLVESKGDLMGYTIVDLGVDSFHSETDACWELYCVTGSLRTPDEQIIKNMRKYHSYEKHCYCIPNTILNADVIISVPKLKSHRKAGITASLKNFIGIGGLKYLPHHKKGTPPERGDEYPHKLSIWALIKDELIQDILKTPMAGRIARKLLLQRHLLEPGAWHGNDTIWRTILDLNTIVKYANKEGLLCNTTQRKFLFVVDGIIGQEDEGPVLGDPKKCGVTLLGINPCAVDYVAAKLAGFDVKKIKQITVPFERRKKIEYPLVDHEVSGIKVISNVNEYEKIHELKRERSLKFRATKGWKILEESC